MQQYIDPQVKAGIKDPISPFFDIVGSLITRQGRLAIGLIVVIPPRELDVLRDQRGDMVHRLLQSSLDLRTIYDQDFPTRLWNSLAKEYEFREHSDRILSPETLISLGQIGARDDLSDGPRTVVNTFRRATRLYQERNYPVDNPYTPESIVNDLLTGGIEYDSSKRIPTVAARALDHSLVKGRPDHERAVKWAAAFPNEGVTRAMQEQHGLANALDELAQSALGDLVLSVGDVRNKGFTLAGLEAKPISTDWLSVTLRNFGRDYVDTADIARQRALNGFMMLLQHKAFPENQWKVESKRPSRITQNAGIIFRGAYTTSRQRYPDRLVHVRLLWEDEPVKDAQIDGDVLVEIRLRRYLEMAESDRRSNEVPLQIDANGRTIRLTLNLMGQTTDISPRLEQVLSSVVSPYKLTPQLLLNLYDVLDGKLQDAQVAKGEIDQVRHMVQPELLDNSFRQLFNETVGQPVEAAQERLLETALLSLLEAIYPDYRPLMTITSWRSSLDKYRNALQLLDSRYQRQGQADVEGTKDAIATLFAQTNTSLDSFARNFPALIEGVEKLPGKNAGVVRFSLHPLEQAIKKWLAESPSTKSIKKGNQSEVVHSLPKQDIYKHARALGYQDDEIDALVGLMVLRGLVEEDTRLGNLHQAVNIVPSADEVETRISEQLDDLEVLLGVFSDDKMLQGWRNNVTRAKERLAELRRQPDDRALDEIERGLRALGQQIDSFAVSRQRELGEGAERMTRQVPAGNPSTADRLKKQLEASIEYVYQVNEQLRLPLLKTYSKLESDGVALRQKLELTRGTLQGEELSIPTLAGEVKALKAHQEAIDSLANRHSEFTRQFDDYTAWGKLVADGNSLSELLNQMGELATAQRQGFEDLSRDIRGHLSAYKLEALPDTATYSLQLSEIATKVEAIRTTSIREFTELQDRYRQAIMSTLHLPPDRLWQVHYLNPLAYDDSYVRLLGDVHGTIGRTVVNHFRGLIEDMQNAIRSTLQSPLVKQLPSDEQSQLQAQGRELQTQLVDLGVKLTTIREMATLEAVKDFPSTGGGQFEAILQQLGAVVAAISHYRGPVEAMSRSLQRMALEGGEQALLDVIATSAKAQDLGSIRQSSELGEREFWQALSGLQAKRRVRITVERVSND